MKDNRFSFDFLYRKKKFTEDEISNTKLKRVMSLWDISAIGISSTLGAGIYVLAGQVIALYSGPSIVLSFIIAGFVTFFSGICYAELGARVPKSGSAYTYIYVTIGEFCAFIMGWDLILEYIVGTASIANALSQYIDVLCNKRIRDALQNAMPMFITGLGPYPDFLAFGLAFAVSVMLIIGVKESSMVNKIFTVLNISVLVTIIILGSTKVDFQNWNLHLADNFTWIDEKNQNQSCSTSPRCGNSGYMPFKFNGVIRGAAKCFYAYIGFDAIAATGEEVVNPKRNIPLAIIITLSVVATLYCFISGVLTLMVPYYLIDMSTPLPQAFNYVGLNWAQYLVTAGAVASLSTCLYAGAFPMPRIVYSMAQDGLIFRFLGKVMPKLQTPFMSTLLTGLFAAILATIFDLNELVDMLSIGTLMAYTLVSICVLILRYQPEVERKVVFNRQNSNSMAKTTALSIIGMQTDTRDIEYESCDNDQEKQSVWDMLFRPRAKQCTKEIANMVFILTIIAVLSIVAICIIVSHSPYLASFGSIISLAIFGLALIISFVIICRQPQCQNITTFKIPFVPLLPLVSVFFNVYLMMTLAMVTWARFIIWFLIGCVVYFAYGIRESDENKYKNKQYWFLPCLLKSSTVNDIQMSPIKVKLGEEPSSFQEKMYGATQNACFDRASENGL